MDERMIGKLQACIQMADRESITLREGATPTGYRAINLSEVRRTLDGISSILSRMVEERTDNVREAE